MPFAVVEHWERLPTGLGDARVILDASVLVGKDFECWPETCKDGICANNAFLCEPRHPFTGSVVATHATQHIAPIAGFAKLL
jgi:hypothetical protein